MHAHLTQQSGLRRGGRTVCLRLHAVYANIWIGESQPSGHIARGGVYGEGQRVFKHPSIYPSIRLSSYPRFLQFFLLKVGWCAYSFSNANISYHLKLFNVIKTMWKVTMNSWELVSIRHTAVWVEPNPESLPSHYDETGSEWLPLPPLLLGNGRKWSCPSLFMSLICIWSLLCLCKRMIRS